MGLAAVTGEHYEGGPLARGALLFISVTKRGIPQK